MAPSVVNMAKSWFFASLPIVLLLLGMLRLRWPAPKAGTVSWISAMLIAYFAFGAGVNAVSLANAKGMSLTIFVTLIIWTSVLLYNLVEKSGAVKAISSRVTGLVSEPLLKCLLLAWCVSGFIQGIAGFGVPVAIVAPLMLAVGFDPVTSAVATLVGHAWSISFGSMAASYYTLTLVTRIPGAEAAFWMGAMLFVPTLLSGFAVAHIYGGTRAMKRGAVPVLIIGLSMAATQWIVPSLGAPQIGAMMAGLVGAAVTVIVSRTGLYREDSARAQSEAPRGLMSSGLAFLPYYVLVGLTLFSQIPAIKEAARLYRIGLDFPAVTTSLGYAVKAERAYAAIGLLSHPAPLILASALVGIAAYSSAGKLSRASVVQAAQVTYKQCVPTTVSIATMVMMALVMNDSGMTSSLASGVASLTGRLFPLFSPYIGVLGCFMTGSNTNSNVLFGAFQVETAVSLGISTRIMAAVQSAGGSLGSAIAPAKVLIGSTTVGLSGKENSVMNKTIPYCMAIVAVVGIIAWLSAYVFFPGVL